MLHNVLMISIKDHSLQVAVSYWLILIIIAVPIAWYLWQALSGRFKADVELQINLGGVASVTIKPNNEVKQIAYQVWVELKTRKAGLPIDKENDVISDIYDSWYDLFGEIRTLTRSIPAPKLKDENTKKLVELLIDTLNKGLRPHLTIWQAKYRWWYDKAVAKSEYESLTPQDIQNNYPKCKELVEDMLLINRQLVDYTEQIKRLVDA
jgi:hypothetical protein